MATWEEILAKAKKATDDEFASQISSKIRLTDAEIKEIAPTELDKVNLAKLGKIVNDAAMSNEKKAEAIRNTVGLAEVAVGVISKFL
jgi:hypothetical protein